MRRGDKAPPEQIRKAICLSVKEGLDPAAVRSEWEVALKFLTTTNQLRVAVNPDHRGEIRIDWHTFPSDIAQYTAYLQSREEYGGNIAYLDVYEHERGSASQQKLQQLCEQRSLLQQEAESDAKVALLQPRVCSLEGMFQAAELGNVEALKAMIRGYPLPTYDTNTGTYRPNTDRTALPQQKHVLRQNRQLAHTESKLQHTTTGSYAAGSASDDLLQAAPFQQGTVQQVPLMLDVQVLRARKLLAADKGLTGRTSDPYVRMHVGDSLVNSVQTAVKTKALEPVWEETISIRIEGAQRTQKLHIECLDHDLVGENDSLGKTTIDLAELEELKTYKEWRKLRNVEEGAPENAGEVELQYTLAEIVPVVMVVKVLRARNLVADAGGRCDPYVSIYIADNVSR